MRHTQLRAFHHVALHGGFSRAAQALGLTQPAVSDQVKQLEKAHDVLLLKRTTKSVSLTDAGARLFEITRRMFDAERAALELLTRQNEARAGNLQIFADSPHHILHVLASFRTQNPNVSVKVGTGNSQEILAALKTYDADIGIVGEVPSERTLDVVALGASDIVAFARKGGALDGFPTISVHRLLELPLVLREPGSKTRAKLEQAAGKLPQAIEAEGREAVREIVAAGGGIGIVSQAEYVDDPNLTSARITDPELTMEEAVICLRERSENRLIAAFMKLTRHAASRAAIGRKLSQR
ncbi:MAG: LysR substrate-binding domain-containing protein [Pseudomonadota bacterium]